MMSYFETNTFLLMLLLVGSLFWLIMLAIGVVLFRRTLWPYRAWIAGLVALPTVIFAYSSLTLFVFGVPVARSSSPYGNYYLEYYKYPIFISSIGGGSDFSGRVKLKNHFGKTIATAEFPIFFEVREPTWTDDGVRAGLVFDWEFARLPQ